MPGRPCVKSAIAAGPRPKRTVRFVLFTGEEIGLLGSRGYVAAHEGEIIRALRERQV